MYDQNLKRKWDNESVMEYAVSTGRAEGEHKKAVEVALELKKEGFPLAKITKITKLPVEEIEKL